MGVVEEWSEGRTEGMCGRDLDGSSHSLDPNGECCLKLGATQLINRGYEQSENRRWNRSNYEEI